MCDHLCNGGITYRYRHCQREGGPPYIEEERKECNKQPCIENTSTIRDVTLTINNTEITNTAQKRNTGETVCDVTINRFC